jgi:hypothetical protein
LPSSDNVAEDREIGFKGLDSCYQSDPRREEKAYLERQELLRKDLLRSSEFKDISGDTNPQI